MNGNWIPVIFDSMFLFKFSSNTVLASHPRLKDYSRTKEINL